MDRNREGRRTSMAAPPNGLSRRRHRSNSLRDSPEEDGQVEMTEPAAARLRDRVGLKKDRDRDRDREREREMRDRDRDRERERERERSSRSKRRRENRMMHGGVGSSREDGGDDTSEESVNDDEDEDEDDGSRVLPPPSNSAAAAAAVVQGAMSNNNHHTHAHQLYRKSFPPSGNKVFRAAAAPVAAPPPTWKAADEMIGVSVPRKARSASTKRTHDCVSGGGGVAAVEQINRQSSASPVRLASAAASPVAAAPVSPSSSNVSIRKKMKPNGGGAKPRPPKSTSKSSSSNPEELEIEIAEVLYGLMTQSQAAPSKKEIVSNDSANKFESNKSSSDAKSRVSSPISNSTPSNAPNSSPAPLSAVAPKRKKPRQVSDFSSIRSSPGSSMKTEIEHQSPKTEVTSPNLEKSNSGSVMADNGGDIPYGFAGLGNQHRGLPLEPLVAASAELKPMVEEDGKNSMLLGKEEVSSPKKDSPKKESSPVRAVDSHLDVVMATATVSSIIGTKLSTGISATESTRDDKFQIDLMAPPPQLKSSPDREGEINFADHKRMAAQVDAEMKQMMKDKEAAERAGNIGKLEPVNVVEKAEEKGLNASVEQVEEYKKPVLAKERNIDLQFDLEKPDNRDGTSTVSGSSNRPLQHPPRHHQPTHKSARDEPHTEKTGHPSSLPLPMSVTGWPGGLPPMGGFVAPLQGVVSMDGNAMPSTPIQPIFTQPRPKRCATHCYIARNIHCLQQFMKMNPFWPTAAGAAPIFGAKPCNLNVLPSTELHGSMAGVSLNSVQDKTQGLAIFPGHTGKEISQATAVPDPAQRKQQVVLQQAIPPVGPSNILHGPAFIFPFNQQQAAVAAACVRPSSAKSTTPTGSSAASTAPNSAAGSASATAAPPMSFVGATGAAPNPMSFMGASATAPAAMSFNYPNMSPNETQYLAILQNNAYPFPMPPVGAPPNYRGSPHAQAMPLFSGSFYSSQMIHPSQLQQQQPPQAPSQPQQISQGHRNTSSGSSSSQKQLQMQQQQQRQQQGTAIDGSSGGNLHNYPGTKARSSQQPQQQNQHITPPQARIHENEVGAEDNPSTADSRVARAAATMNVYGQNFAMPIHPQNFAMMTPPAALGNASGTSNEKKQPQQSQQQGSKSGMESLPPQTFAMSFGPMNGSTATGIDISSMAHNHAILQSLPESTRHNYQQIMAAAHHAQQKKNFRISEEAKNVGGSDLSNAEKDRKVSGLAGKSGQSIAFSRPDLTDASGSSAIPGNSVIDSSSRNLNLASTPGQTPRSPMPSSVGSPGSHLQAQLHQQQQMLHLQKQQHQNQQQLASSMAGRSKNPPTSNGSVYSEHLIPSSSSVAAKFPNSLSSFPQNLVQTSNNSNSPAQSPQWKNSTRTPTSQAPSSLASSTTSSLKNLPPQQQASRTLQQSHTQISFGSNQKPSTAQGQQPSNSSSQCPSPPMMVGSPTSSISKGASGSPRTNASASTSNKNVQAASLSSQQAKNSQAGPSQRSSPSILGNPQVSSTLGASKSLQQQQQLSKQHQQLQQAQQAHLFFSSPYMQQAQAQAHAHAHAQAQAQAQHSGSTAASGYYLQRRRTEQSQQGPGSSTTSSTGMLSLSSPVTLPTASTSDPAKAIAAAAAAASNMKGGGLPSQGILHAAQFVAQVPGNAHQMMPTSYSFVHPVPAAVQVKPAEQKQPAGNDSLHACWQPEKK